MHSVRYYYEMKKALRGDANTARASCSKAEPKIFAPSQTPFPGAQDGQNLISWRCKIITRYLTRGGALYLPLYLQTQFGEDRCTQFRVIVVTDPPTHTHTHTNRQDRLQYTAPQLARSVIAVLKVMGSGVGTLGFGSGPLLDSVGLLHPFSHIKRKLHF